MVFQFGSQKSEGLSHLIMHSLWGNIELGSYFFGTEFLKPA